MKAIEHLKTINHHKLLVMEICFKLGLYWQGLLHDLSKYTPTEFMTGAKYYVGDKSPNTVEREARGYTAAWLHHKGRNKHHLEYWIDYDMREGGTITGMKMPTKYVVEMFADRIAACKNYQKDKYTDASAYIYYEKGRAKTILHKESAALLVLMLKMLKKRGEDYTYRFIRRYILMNDAYCRKHGIHPVNEYSGYEVLDRIKKKED